MTAVAEIPTVRLERRFKVSAQRLFAVMTTPHHMEQWFSPSQDYHVSVQAHDFRQGGVYALAYRNPAGEETMVRGEFVSIRPGREVAFTWTWDAPDPHAGIFTLVTWTFEPVGDGCRLSVTHERLPDTEARERHSAGWDGTLDRLSLLLENGGA